MTKALYPKRPALIPMFDSIVQKYLQDDDLGAQAPFAERALGLVRGYQRNRLIAVANESKETAEATANYHSGYPFTRRRMVMPQIEHYVRNAGVAFPADLHG